MTFKMFNCLIYTVWGLIKSHWQQLATNQSSGMKPVAKHGAKSQHKQEYHFAIVIIWVKCPFSFQLYKNYKRLQIAATFFFIYFFLTYSQHNKSSLHCRDLRNKFSYHDFWGRNRAAEVEFNSTIFSLLFIFSMVRVNSEFSCSLNIDDHMIICWVLMTRKIVFCLTSPGGLINGSKMSLLIEKKI